MYDFPRSWLSAPATRSWMERNGVPFPEDPDFHKWDDFQRMGFSSEDFAATCEAGVNEGHIFRVGEPFPGVRDVILALQEEGHTIHIITHRTWGKRSVQNTMEWFEEYDIPFNTITFAEDKTIVGVDLLLDDRDVNYYHSVKSGIPCVLMDRDWNAHVVEAPRVSDWDDFHEYVRGFDEDMTRLAAQSLRSL